MYLDIDKNSIPYKFDVSLSDEIFNFEIHYNARFDYFTVNLRKNNELLATGEKLVLGKSLFTAIAGSNMPKPTITPIDESGQEKRITFDNLGETVLLWVGGINE